MDKLEKKRKFYHQKKKSKPIVSGLRIAPGEQNQFIQENQVLKALINEREEDVNRLEVLGQIKQSVLVDQTPQEFASKTFDLLFKLIPYDYANVILFNFRKSRARVLAVHGGHDIGLMPGDILPLEECFASWEQIETKHIQSDPTALSPQPFCFFDNKLKSTGIQSHISLLLISHNEVIGSLNIASTQQNAFDKKSLRVARDVADSLAVAIQKATLFQETRVKAAELEALAELSSALRKAEKWTEIIHIMIRTSIHFMNASYGGFLWLDDKRIFRITTDTCQAPECFQKDEWASNQQIVDMLNLNSPIFDSENLDENLAHLPLPRTVQSIAILPIKTVGVIAGKLYLAFDARREFSKEDRRLLTSMADIAGNALYRANILETLEQRVTDRTRELSTLYAITNIISRSLDLKSTLEQCLKSLLEVLGAQIGFIHFIDKDSQTLVRQAQEGWHQNEQTEESQFFLDIYEKQQPLLITDLKTNQAYLTRLPLLESHSSFISAPIFGRQGISGLISFFSSQPNTFNHEELSLLTSVANHISIAVENTRLHLKADEAIVIEERQRLARELHDSISQLLYSQLLFSEASLKLVNNDNNQLLTTYLRRLADVADQAFREMRLMIYSLRPKVLESVGLSGALQHRLNTVEQRAGMDTKLVIEGVTNLPAFVEDGLFRIAQEALNNALKHASASSISVRLEQIDQTVEMEVVDNGTGFDRKDLIEGIGFSSMQERAKQIGGKLIIQSMPGKGATVKVSIDLAAIKRKKS